MVGPWPLAPHHDHSQYIHHGHLMQRGQNRDITEGITTTNMILPFRITRSWTTHIWYLENPSFRNYEIKSLWSCLLIPGFVPQNSQILAACL